MKKVILTTILISVFTIIVIILSTNKESGSLAIQNTEFVAADGYQTVSVDLDITNDENNFMINGEVVPEEIRVEPETTLEVNVTNDSEFPTSIHFHGINGNSNMDGVAGVSQDSIMPGGNFTYKFNLNEVGTYMYHAHLDSAEQVNNRNLYGGLVVEDVVKTNSDMLIYNTNINDIDQHHTANQTFDNVLVNGSSDGSMNVENDENIYLNIANLSSTPLSVNFGLDVKYRVNSIDANPSQSIWVSNESLIIPTGNRLIVEIENPKQSFQISTSLKAHENATYDVYYKNDRTITEQDFSAPVSNDMMSNIEFDDLADDSVDLYDLVETNNDLDVRNSRPDVNVNMNLDMSNGMWVINDEAFPDTQAIDVKEGDVVEITLTNTSHMAEAHPFHLHGHKFQVMEVNGAEVEKNLVLDTVNVKPGDEVVIKFNANNPGIWAFHCHNLVHAGLGMLTTLNYEGYTTNVTDTPSE